jgi:hypothetical protein
MVNIYVLNMEGNTFLVVHIKRQIGKQRVGVIVTKFNDDFIKKVKQHWEENKNTINGKKQGHYRNLDGVHREVIRDKKFTMDDLADHFSISIGQAKRIIYLK